MSDFTEQSDAKRDFAKADDGFGKMRDKG